MPTSLSSQPKQSARASKPKSNSTSLLTKSAIQRDIARAKLTNKQQPINELIGGRFDVAEAKQKEKRNCAEKPLPSVETPDDIPTPAEDATPTINGVHKSSEESAASPSPASSPVKREADDDDLSDVMDDAPPKKKRKAGGEDDAAIAARLQAEEDRKARSTRGAGGRKTAPTKKKKTPRKKSKNRIGSDDDSDVNGEAKPEKPKSNTGFHVRTIHRCLRFLLTSIETTQSLTPALSSSRRRHPDVSTTSHQAALGSHQGQQLARPG